MKIKEVENLTGITSKNIRFYEKEGLINPNRLENGYRDYSDEDIRILKEIKLYRKLDISLEDIKCIQKGILSIDSCMKKYSDYIEEKIKKMNKAKEICDLIRNESKCNEDVDVERFLHEIDRYEGEGHKFKNIAHDFITKAKGMIPSFTAWFEPDEPIMNSRDFTNELLKYSNENNIDLTIIKESMEPMVMLDGVKHVAMLEPPRMINIPFLPGFYSARSYGFKFVYLYRCD